MPRAALSVALPVRLLGWIGGVALAGITLVYPAATRMYASPWTIALAVACLSPALMLLLRCFDRETPIVLPPRGALLTTIFAAVVILLSAAFSPYRASSLLWSFPLLAAVAVFHVTYDLLHRSSPASPREGSVLEVCGWFLAAVAVISIVTWLSSIRGRSSAAEIFNARNPFPLGHANYTAGLGLLMLPCFVALAVRRQRVARVVWSIAAALALAMIFTSGSRGGFLGLAVLGVGFIFAARLGRRRTLGSLAVIVVIGCVALVANPRTRSVLLRDSTNQSDLASGDQQRRAMWTGGVELGRERPWLGWGPGTTPLAFPHVRGQVVGGVEDVLQLHSLPIQLWAELGVPGVLILLAMIAAIISRARRAPYVAAALAAYLAFSLTDYQWDVPVIGFAVAILLAMLAPPPGKAPPAQHVFVAGLIVAATSLIAACGRRDPSPEWNVRALTLASDPATKTEAVQLLERSLALNADQEIACFNLGWLLLLDQPERAADYFAQAARLVPDKGGVYFGFALATLDRAPRDKVVHALALESFNDPIFLVSPWWRNARLGPLRHDTFLETQRLLRAGNSPDAAYVSAVIDWLDGSAPATSVVPYCATSERRAFFAAQPVRAVFSSSPILYYRRARAGYPVLMRNLDLAVPTDLFEVQENALAAQSLRFLFPPKGWAPVSSNERIGLSLPRIRR